MGMKILVISDNVALWDFIDDRGSFFYEYVGYIGVNFNQEMAKTKHKDIRQFKYVGEGEYTIFNANQVQNLYKEIEILEEEGYVSKEVLELIKIGANKVLENNNRYLKFEDD